MIITSNIDINPIFNILYGNIILIAYGNVMINYNIYGMMKKTFTKYSKNVLALFYNVQHVSYPLGSLSCQHTFGPVHLSQLISHF